MKLSIPTLAGSLMLCAGCATNVHSVVQDVVGPCPPIARSESVAGCLVVYSCWDFDSPVNYDYEARAPYTVASADGKLMTSVFNDTGGFDRNPVQLSLPAGEYQVTSFIPRLGDTTVPVQIQPGQTTAVYLDGSANCLKKRMPANSLVSLPDGYVAGCRSSHELTAK